VHALERLPPIQGALGFFLPPFFSSWVARPIAAIPRVISFSALFLCSAAIFTGLGRALCPPPLPQHRGADCSTDLVFASPIEAPPYMRSLPRRVAVSQFQIFSPNWAKCLIYLPFAIGPFRVSHPPSLFSLRYVLPAGSRSPQDHAGRMDCVRWSIRRLLNAL